MSHHCLKPTAPTMEEAKKRINHLIELRIAIEKDIEERITRLEAPGGPGRTGNLLDSEGYPRSDIDLHSVREDRHQIAVLTNDHKSISDQIQKSIEELHHHARLQNISNTSSSQSSSTSQPKVFYPFAVVDSVSDNSPAVTAGIQISDELCQFGEIKGSQIKNPKILTRLAAALRANEGKEVETIFLRNNEPQRMVLVPQKWNGPGLIGCHLRPMQ